MVDEDRSNQEIDDREELERALALLKPAGSRIDRDSFLFLAGRASAERIRPGGALRQWMWPAATLVSTLAALVLFALLMTRPQAGGTVAESQAAKSHGAESPAAESPSAASGGKRVPSVAEKVPAESVSEARGPVVESNLVSAATSFADGDEITAAPNYPRLRSLVLAYGIDELPEPIALPQPASDAAAAGEPRTERELLQSLSKGRG